MIAMRHPLRRETISWGPQPERLGRRTYERVPTTGTVKIHPRKIHPRARQLVARTAGEMGQLRSRGERR